MLKKLLPCLILAGTAHAADSVRIYNWTDYIAPDTLKQFERAAAGVPITTSTTATRRWTPS